MVPLYHGTKVLLCEATRIKKTHILFTYFLVNKIVNINILKYLNLDTVIEIQV